MLQKQCLFILTLLLGAMCFELFAQTVYPSEKPIVFETRSGEKTDAFSGFITVPENRANRESRQIDVHYVRFPATGKSKGAPIIYLAGGPGGSGIKTAQIPNFRFPLFMALREFGDVIALDQRGTGKSTTTERCTSSQVIPLDSVVNTALLNKKYRQAAAECVAFWQSLGADVLGYTTRESVSDIDALREHFKADKVSLWGISYGSHLALAALNQLPGKIDKVVMASAEGLDQTVKLPKQTDLYFSRLQAAINTQPNAKAAYPNINVLIKRVHKNLENAPVPVTFTTRSGKQVEMLLQKMHMQIIASYMIADPHRGVKSLLKIYDELDKGEVRSLIPVLQRGFFSNEPISFSLMSFAMDIASGVSEKRLSKIEKQAESSLLGLALNFPMPQLNKSVNGLDLGEGFRTNPVSDVPTLLLSGTLDGRTYLDSQLDATQGLSNLQHITIVNGGHNIFMVSPDVTNNIKRFLAGKPLTTTQIEIDLPQFASEK